MTETVLLVGCGNMGFAMLSGWLSARDGLRAHVVEPDADLRRRAGDAGAAAVAGAEALPRDLAPDLIFLAVKPQVMGEVLTAYQRFAGGGPTFVSVAAGTTLATLEAGLPGPTPVIRCMPNTPAAIGAGMLVCVANAHVPETARDLAAALLEASGDVAWIEDEALMDAVTAVSGSGPAYLFHFVEALAAAGAAAGLPADLSLRLARQTAFGAARLAVESGTDPGVLREQVTSPGGTTAAALSALTADDSLKRLLAGAVEAARARGAELGKA